MIIFFLFMIINKIKFSTYCEDAKFKNQDYTVRYLKDKNIKYGLIRRFYQISNTIYAIVEKKFCERPNDGA